MPEESEEWIEATDDERRSVSLSNRIELMTVTIGVGDHVRLVDPDDEVHGEIPGAEEIPLVVLDLAGHLHPGDDVCVPVSTPYLVTPDALDKLIDGLCEARTELEARYPSRSPK